MSDFDSMSDSSSSSSDDQEDIDSLYNGRARSIFSNLEETIDKIDDFLLFERPFSEGEIVRLVSDSLGQLGRVVNIDITVDFENTNGRKTRNVSSKDLHKLRSVSVGDYVIHNAWLGKVNKIVDRLTILFDDGTKCELTDEGPEKIVSLTQDLIEDPPFRFYPGQRVQIESSVLKSTHWLCGVRRDYKQEQGTVINVDAGVVYVDWLISAAANGERGPSPPCVQDSKRLTVLPCYPYANWQLGDWAVILPVDDESGDHSTRFQEIGVIVKTKTKVDVMWQDGSESLGLDSNEIYPVNVIDAHDFWPDSFVLEKGAVDDDKQVSKWGFVRSVDSKERTVGVKWCGDFLDCEEIVSAYELVEHPDYSYCLGEIVFRPYEIIAGPTDGGGEDDCLENEFLSCFGTVVGFQNGGVEVKWGNGATSKVAPYEIYRVDKCEGTNDENVQPPNEELLAKNQFPGHELKDVSGLNNDNTKELSISQVAIGLFTSITSNILLSLSKFTSEVGKTRTKSPNEEESLELSSLNIGGKFEDLEITANTTSLVIKEASEDEEITTLPLSSKVPESSFSPFDMVNDCSDHHFVNESGMDTQSPQVRRSWLKKVQQEWSILEKDLPETIYIRAYEERMDLLRAAIVGSDGTPYHDGLFFFDIYLPPQYPNEPPMVHYNSGGLRINPNLYESGKICLSLLNTWTGSQTEVWNPKSSTILQLLLSLQALVLNEKPYFNEAGYDSQIGKAEGEKNSFSYNENAFLVSCRSMLYLLRNPPRNFEVLVNEHFNRRSRNILLACKEYMKGARIGYPFECDQEVEDDIMQGRSSTGFKIMLKKVYSRLVEAFSDKGIDCGESVI